MSNFLEEISRDNAAELMRARQQPVLVAISGGADSVCLLRVLIALGCDCRGAHCNFHLRSDESMRDERFVRNLCECLSVPLVVKDFDVANHQLLNGGSIEMACRDLRYSWFEKLRQEMGCGLIAVAHHADDQVETFFLNLLRGTGMRGLEGMSRMNGHIWRPLLGIGREGILCYLHEINQDYVTDSTNLQNDYRRNRLRNIVLPVLERSFPQAKARIQDTMDHLKQDYQLMSLLTKLVLPDVNHIDTHRLSELPDSSTLLYHRIRHLGFNRVQCDQIIEAMRNGHFGRHFITPTHALHVNRQTLDIEENVTCQEVDYEVDLSADITSPVRVEICDNNPPFSPFMCDGKYKVAFDRRVLRCQRIVLRHWRRGDRMRPFGMSGSKLLSDLFADLKLDHADKRDVWLLEADGDILWVLGFRSSNLYPVTRESQDYLLLHFQKLDEKFA